MAEQSLFGMADPELVKQLIQAEEARNITAQAQFTPAQMQNLIQLQAGQQLGRGVSSIVGSLFGVEAVDPRVRRAQQAQSIINEVNTSGLDPNSPDYYAQVARLAQQRGLPDLAQMAVSQVQALQKARADIGLKTAQTLTEIKKATAEANPFAKIDPSKYTPESLAKYSETQNVSDLRLNPESVGGGAKVTIAQETSFAKGRGEEQAKALTLAASNASTAGSSLAAVNEMEKLATSNQLYSGPLAMTAVGAANFLNSIGLLSPNDSRTLANSEIYDKKAKDLVMQDLGGKLGAQISDADRKFVEARIPQLTNSPTARLELIQKMKEIQQGKISLYQRMNEHANKFGQLNTFDFSQSYVPTGISSSPLGTKDNPIKLR